MVGKPPITIPNPGDTSSGSFILKSVDDCLDAIGAQIAAPPDLLKQARMTSAAALPRARDLPDPAVIYSNAIVALIARRHELSLTQRQVDQIAGFADALTAKYEIGDRRPTAYALAVWAASLNAALVLVPLSATVEVMMISQRKPWQRGSAKRRDSAPQKRVAVEARSRPAAPRRKDG